MGEATQTEVRQEQPPMNMAEFLESIPPSNLTRIVDLTDRITHPSGGYAWHDLNTPEIQLHCPNDTCNGSRFFRCTNDIKPRVEDYTYSYCYITYRCWNCQKEAKTFSLAARRDKDAESGGCYKFGELPPYGPPTPARLIKLLGPDRDLFVKGRRCENQGLGIGAFVYYRRVVENEKNRILDEIIKVSNKIGVVHEIITTLESAKAETQFSKSLAAVKNAIPQSLLINGHNPLTLLHSALSEGLHDQTDEHCLEIARSVRIVLGELSERLAQALKDEAELNSAFKAHAEEAGLSGLGA